MWLLCKKIVELNKYFVSVTDDSYMCGVAICDFQEMRLLLGFCLIF